MSAVYLSEQGTYLRKRDNRYVLSDREEVFMSLPQTSVDSIFVLGNIQISTQALSKLLEDGVDILFMKRNGGFKGILRSAYPKNSFVRIRQYEWAVSPSSALIIARSIIRGKIEYQNTSLKKWKRNGWIEDKSEIPDLSIFDDKLSRAENIQSILAVEAMASKLYFSAFNFVLPPGFEWHGRNRRPPRDPVNGLLSLTYMMTLSIIVSESYSHALDPYIGFLHQLDYGRPSFALDILELCRALYCDHFVISALQKDVFEYSDFTFGEDTGCRMKPEPIKEYFRLFHDLRTKKGRNSMSMDKFIKSILNNFVKQINNGRLE